MATRWRSRTAAYGGAFLLAAMALAGCAAATPAAAPTRSTPGAAPTTTAPTTGAPTTQQPPTQPPTTQPAATPTAPGAQPRPEPGPAPSCSLPAEVRGRDLEVLPTGTSVVALTFDAGGSAAGVRPILDTLAARAAPATFFLTGDFATAFPAQARAIAGAHPVGNHTLHHLDLTTLPDPQVRDEVRRGAAAIRAATGVDPAPYLRFPFGARDARTIALVNDECFAAIRWTVDSLGWKGTSGGQSAATVSDRVLGALRPGAIVLLHVGANPDDGSTLDADALAGLVDAVRARGYTLTTVPAALGG